MRRRQAVTGWLLAAPAVVGLLAFLVLPFCYTVFRSFTSGLGWGQFVGLENYAQLFGNRLFLLALKNTFLFLACGLALILPLSLFLALLLQKLGNGASPFFDLSFYISKISWAMEGVDLGRLEWGGLPVRAWTIAGLCLLAMALVSTLAAGILFVSALGNKRDKENA